MRREAYNPAAVLALALAASPPARSEVRFDGPLTIRGSLAPTAVAAGDFNRDGKLDLAAPTGSAKVFILFQDPVRRDRWRETALPGVTTAPYFVKAADLDGDGDDDLALGAPAGALSIVLCRGDGSFDPPRRAAVGGGPRWIAVRDVNGDGRADLALANHAEHQVQILHGKGQGQFQVAQTLTVPAEPHALDFIHDDRDGVIDLFVGLAQDGYMTLKGLTDGRFQAQGRGARCVDALCPADFNRDGLGDLAGGCEETFASVWIHGEEPGMFRWPLETRPESVPSPAVADLDHDGLEDLAVVTYGSRMLLTYRGKGDGTFHPQEAFGPTGQNPLFLISGDLDRDGLVDLVSANGTGVSLTVFWGRPEPPFLASAVLLGESREVDQVVVADLEGDGALEVFTTDHALVDIFPAPVLGPNPTTMGFSLEGSIGRITVADLDGDGFLDVAANQTAAGAVAVGLLAPGGRLKRRETLPAGIAPGSVAAGRIDGGPALDLVVPLAGEARVAIFLGRGDGTFVKAPPAGTLARPKALALADLDGDGMQDLVVAGLGAVALQFGDGGGGFSAPATLNRPPSPTEVLSDVAASDLDGDGTADLLVAPRNSGVIEVFRGMGGGRFLVQEPIQSGGRAESLILHDLDHDGLPEVAVALDGYFRLRVFPNRGGFAFGLPLRLELRGLPAFGDVDGDGVADLVASGMEVGSHIVIHRGRLFPAATSFRRGDLNADGRVEISDPIAALDRLFRGGEAIPCPDAADANDDGTLDISDPVTLLSWLFLSGAPPPAPGPLSCGEDPTGDALPPCQVGC